MLLCCNVDQLSLFPSPSPPDRGIAAAGSPLPSTSPLLNPRGGESITVNRASPLIGPWIGHVTIVWNPTWEPIQQESGSVKKGIYGVENLGEEKERGKEITE